MKKYLSGIKKVTKNNTKLLIGLFFGLLISLPVGIYALKSHDSLNNQSNQNQTSNEQPNAKEKTTTTNPTTQTTKSDNNSQSSSTSSSIKPSVSSNNPSAPTQETISSPTLISCTNNNDVQYETHSLYRNGAGHIQGVNGWSKNCTYSDGHSTKETYAQPITEYFYVYFYIPDSNNARNQCTSYVGVSNTQAINECVDIATTLH